jgi:1-deoxy-D-xylulose-5-phosphate synthase
MDAAKYPILASLGDPLELHGFDMERLETLAEEARAFLIETISRTGGHLGAALGVVELTVALFHHYDFLRDRICWDVGHQAHVYKMLTGRAHRFADYGTWGGLCKFLERRESPYDHMGAGHASTSVSAALGMAFARDRLGEEHHVLAVIGDGAMTGGLAFEALNLAGALNLNLLVVLNDNGMSIDENVGVFSRTVTRITSSEAYNALRDEVKRLTRRVPFGSEILNSLKHMERSVKDYAAGDEAAFFESLNWRYFGPVEAHNLRDVSSLLSQARTMRGPVLVHVHSVKGKGLGPEIENTFEAHAVSPSKPQALPASGAAQGPPAPARKSWTQIYSEGLREIMAEDEHVVALTAAMQSNTGLSPLAEAFPGRVLDVGIAEANAYCSAAGMAIGGLKPFVTIYSTFSQRAFDQLIHDIALQSLPVRIMMDRGGLVGADGPTHHGVFDFSYLRLIPGFVHMAPRDEREMRRMLLTAHGYNAGPIAMRYARGDTPALALDAPLEPIPIGQGELLREAEAPGLLLVAIGTQVATALAVAEALNAAPGGAPPDGAIPCAVVDARFVKPLDERLLCAQIAAAKAVLTLEENVVNGGMGEAVLALMAARDLLRPTRLLGVPDAFVGFGSQGEQLRACGLLPGQVEATARALWAQVAGKSARRRTQRSA